MAANIAGGVTQRYIIGPNNTRSPLPETIADKANADSTATNATQSSTNTTQNATNNAKNTQNLINTKPQSTKDSLKFAGVQKTFNIMSVIPNSDVADAEISADKQTSDLINRLNALQFAKKTLSDVQSIVKDIKSNYRAEAGDNFAPLNDNALRARYNASVQIRDLIDGAIYKGKNVFLPGYFGDEITLNTGRLNLRNLNLRDELSINIFSQNVATLSDEIETNVRTLQGKLDKIMENKWLSMEQLSGVQLEPKSVNESAKALSAVPSLTSALQAASASGASASPASPASADSTATESNGTDSNVASSDTSASADSSANNTESNSQDSNASPDSVAESNGTQNINSNAQPQVATAGDGGTTSQNTESSTESNTATNTAQDSTNVANANNTTTQTTDSTNNVVGVVSGPENDRVVDLYTNS